MKTKRKITLVALLGGQIAGGPLMINKRRRWPVLISVALTALFVFAAVGCGDSRGGNGNGDTGDGGTGPETVKRCCSEGPPAGYVKIDDANSATCNPDQIDTTTRNHCTYQRYDNKSVGATMDICDQTPPAGWEPATDSLHPDGRFWSNLKCGGPSTITLNMLKIKKTS